MLRLSHRVALPLLVLCGAGVLGCAVWLAMLGDLRADVWKFLPPWSLWFALLLVSFWAVKRVDVPRSVWWILLVSVGARLIVLAMPATLSEDWMRYLWDGRLIVHGHDPYAAVPSDPTLADMHDDVLLSGMNSPDYFTVYPPVSQAVFAVSWWIGGGSIGHALLAMKAIFAAVDVVAVWCMIGWLGAIGLDRRLAILYAWNPMAVVELVGTGHSEVLMVAPMVACLWALARQRDALAGSLLAVAVWVKLFPVLAVVPLARHVGMKRGVRAGVACLMVGLLLGWPMLRPSAIANTMDSLGLYAGVFAYNHGPFALIVSLLEPVTHDAFRIVSRSLLVLFGLWVLAWWIKRPNTPQQLAVALLAIFGGYMVANANVHPWSTAWALWLVPVVWHAGRTIGYGVPWLWMSFAAGWSYLSCHHPPDGSVPPWVLWAEWGVFIALLILPCLSRFWLRNIHREYTPELA